MLVYTLHSWGEINFVVYAGFCLLYFLLEAGFAVWLRDLTNNRRQIVIPFTCVFTTFIFSVKMLYFMMLRSQRKYSDLFSGAVTLLFSLVWSLILYPLLYAAFFIYFLYTLVQQPKSRWQLTCTSKDIIYSYWKCNHRISITWS